MRSVTAVFVGLLIFLSCSVHANPLLELGRAAIESGDYEAAAEVLERAHRAEPRNAAVAHAYATTEVARGNTARALELAEIAVRQDGKNPDHHVLLGNLLAANIDSMGALGKLRAAGRMRSAWEKAVDLDPEHLDARFALASFYAQAPGAVGGGRDKAEAQITEITRRDTVMGHRARAALLRADQDHDGALREYDAALAAVGENAKSVADLQMERGFLCQQAERWACAYDAFHAAIAADTTRMLAWYQVGRTAVLSGWRLEEGVAAFIGYIERHTPRGNEPSIAWAHTRLGTLYEKLGRIDDARAAYQAALILDPDHQGAKAALAALK